MAKETILSDPEFYDFFKLVGGYLLAIDKDESKPEKIQLGKYEFDFETYLDEDLKVELAAGGIEGNEKLNLNAIEVLKMMCGFIAQNLGVSILVGKRFANETFAKKVELLKAQDFQFLIVYVANLTWIIDQFVVHKDGNGVIVNPKNMSFPDATIGIDFRKGLGCTVFFNEEDRETISNRPPMDTYTPKYGPCNSGDLSLANNIDPNPQKDFDGDKLDIAIRGVFKPIWTKSRGTKAVVIVHKGKLIREVYNNKDAAPVYKIPEPRDDVGPYTPLMGWSMTKSVINAILGAMIHEGKFKNDKQLDIQQFAAKNKENNPGIPDGQIVENFLKTVKIADYLDLGPGAETITLNDLLRMVSGLKWKEDKLPFHVMQMVYGHGDMAAYAARLGVANPPNLAHNYSSGDSNLIAAVMKACFEKENVDPLKAYWEFAHTHLFEPTGMCNTILQADLSGTFVGSSYCIASARDWARFGLLYFNKGEVVRTGKRILPKGWVAYSQSLGKNAGGEDLSPVYGAHFWRNIPNGDTNDKNKETGYKGVPVGMYYARGLFGQRVFIVPDKELIVVRIGNRDEIGLKRFLKNVVALF